jgi:hypothetical protein
MSCGGEGDGNVRRRFTDQGVALFVPHGVALFVPAGSGSELKPRYDGSKLPRQLLAAVSHILSLFDYLAASIFPFPLFQVLRIKMLPKISSSWRTREASNESRPQHLHSQHTRNPEQATSTRIYVGNLLYTVQIRDVEDLLKGEGFKLYFLLLPYLYSRTHFTKVQTSTCPSTHSPLSIHHTAS